MDFKFETPKHVMHVLHGSHSFGKSENDHEYRKRLLDQPNKFVFSAGFIDRDTVVLNESIEPLHREFEQSRLLVLTDYTANSNYQPGCDENFRSSQYYSLIKDFQHPRNYSIFKLTGAEGAFKLHLNYKETGPWIGIPQREDFLLAELKPGKPVRVTINGKHDFSLTGRRARTFHLLDYLFVYYGEYSEFTVLPWNRISMPRAFDFSPVKHVDLQKILR